MRGKTAEDGPVGADALARRDAELERVLRDRVRAGGGELPECVLRAVFRELDAAARLPAGGVRVAYLGPEGSFTHAAAVRHFGRGLTVVDQETISDIFAAVQKGLADRGVVPVENSTEGAVTHTMDELASTPLQVTAEVYLPVAHHFLSHAEPGSVRRVYSHPQVFGQCRHWLQRNLEGIEQVALSSTARAAERAAAERDAAALAGSLAAERYGVPVRVRQVQDLAGNTTRFVVIGQEPSPPSGRDKTALCFAVRHRAGALHDALGVFRRHDINLTRIESRPSKMQAWEYLFFTDLEGHAAEEPVASALAELEEHCIMLRCLGSYPRAVPETDGREEA